MTGFTRWTLAVLLAAGLAAPALAQVDLPAADACLTERLGAGQNPAACVEAAHADCVATPPDAPALATVCFREARSAWDRGIGAEMARIAARADERIAAIAGIELKYDLIASRTQCDRMEELALAASSASPEDILRQKSRCEAAAAGLAYLRLKLRAQSID